MKYIFLIILSISLLISSSHADNQKAHTYIHVDEENSHIVIIINDEEIARFTSDGLLLKDNIIYGGTITDDNAKLFNNSVKQKNEENQ